MDARTEQQQIMARTPSDFLIQSNFGGTIYSLRQL
jgi:hypothetical protein